MKNWIGVILVLVSVGMMIGISVVPAGAADVPMKINYQGYLTDDAGTPVDGNTQITFRIYDTVGLGTGTLKWDEVLTVPVSEGLFSVVLGGSSAMTADVFDTASWLETEVETDGPMDPRQELTSAAYAIQADHANSAFALDAVDGLPENAVYVNEKGNVGVGTLNPVGALDVGTLPEYGPIMFHCLGCTGLNDLSIDHSSLYTGSVEKMYIIEVVDDSGDPDTFKWRAGGPNWSTTINMSTNWIDLDDGVRVKWDSTDGHVGAGFGRPDSWDFRAYPACEDALVVRAGMVGINTGTPTVKLEVAGNAKIDGTVGIGTGTPTQKLEIYDAAGASAKVRSGDSAFFIADGANAISGLRMQNSGVDKGAVFWNPGENHLGFTSGDAAYSSPDMVIEDSGNVGIGTDTPNNMLTVNGNADFTGNVVIGPSSPDYPLVVSGSDSYGAYIVNTGGHGIHGTGGNDIAYYGGEFIGYNGVYGIAVTDGDGGYFESNQGTGVYGLHTHASTTSPGVYGRNTGSGVGVYGYASNGTGVRGETWNGEPDSYGVAGVNTQNIGVYGEGKSSYDANTPYGGYFKGYRGIYAEQTGGVYAAYLDGSVWVGNDIYVVDNVSALSFTDRTPYPKDLDTAYEAVMSMQRLPEGQYQEDNKEHQLDHSALSHFVSSEGGRDLSATVSAQNEVIKDLVQKIEVLTNRIEQLESGN